MHCGRCGDCHNDKYVVMTQNIQLMAKLERIEQLTLLAAKDVFNMDDLAAYTGFSKGYLYRLVCERAIPYYKGGGKMNFFKRDDINAWLLQNRIKSQAEIDAAAAAYVVRNPIRKGGKA